MARESVKVGDRFTALVVVELDVKGFEPELVRAKCDCGLLTSVPPAKLQDGTAISCAWRRPTPEYLAWMDRQAEETKAHSEEEK